MGQSYLVKPTHDTGKCVWMFLKYKKTNGYECAFLCIYVFLFYSSITSHSTKATSRLLRHSLKQETLRHPFQEHSFSSSCSISATFSGFDSDSRGGVDL